jgi:aspartate/methionine/tyrosine aminotransferase
VRDFLVKELKEMDLPWSPLPCHSGYFLIADVSKCKSLIPSAYFESHDYDEHNEKGPKVQPYELYIPNSNNKIPLDLAFARWMGKEKGVTMMPNSFFYHPQSPYMNENYVRLAICKDIEHVRKVCQRLRQIRI